MKLPRDAGRNNKALERSGNMQPSNFVAIMAILNAMVERFKDDTVKANLAMLSQPFGTNIASNEKIH